ncbi:vesicle transport protein GOT1-like isoform X9 [Triticum dicoccoides]|uniref:vesicle transport protein GOT1-like isoform X9 n=1 Tax=Triticum dicoccoides TaxID=85692 RepID=UPI000E7B88BA|nr:vesicle transport protein GOT1-like isoform X9 [Triticum dicoccoides]
MLARPASPQAQIIFVSGVSLAIGLKSTVQFFTKPKNRKGSIAFRVVLFLVLIGWPVFGMMADSFGFALLFRNNSLSVHHNFVWSPPCLPPVHDIACNLGCCQVNLGW